MSDDLKTRLGYLAEVLMPWGQQIAIDARNRIEELEAKLREMALDCLAAEGQAAEAYQAQLAAEAKLSKSEALLAKAVSALNVIDALAPAGFMDNCPQTALRGRLREMGGIASTTLAELKGETDGR
jgi:multidrug efflux pump subunit AcrA (membrane-fusion protein)